MSTNVTDAATDVPVDTLVAVTVKHGTVDAVTLTGPGGASIGGEGSDTAWTATDRLEPGTAYTLTAAARGDNGKTTTVIRRFTTQALTLDQQTFAAVAPLNGETVGVAMPVVVYFDRPVTDRAAFEREMRVTSTPAQAGSWTWLSDTEAHYRPETYWQAGTKVSVDLGINGVAAGNGIYGQESRQIDFTIGRSVVTTVDIAAHTMSVVIDGQVARTLPVTTGDPQHATRNGTKVIIEKKSSVDMDAATTGVDSTDPGYYNIAGVRWAQRLTMSGEFIHAAPWSVASQGRANVSHGCTGMSLADAEWLYNQTQRGDPVVYTGGSRALEPGNGWTDWNLPWDQWQAGSALAGA